MERYLVLQKIVETGSFSKAAEALGCTQSAASQMISALENDLHIKLLIRTRNGAILSHEGEALYPFIERTVYTYLAMQEKAREIRGLETGIIRMGTIASISAHWMPKLIKEFQATYPKVEFLMHQGDNITIPEWIKSGSIDFGFVNPEAVKGFKTQSIKQGDMLAILPENHPLAKLEAVPLELLAKEPFILNEMGSYSEALEAFAKEGLKPHIKYTMHDDYGLMTMVEAGLGVSILAELIMHRTSYKIVKKQTIPPIKRTIAIAYKDKNSLPMASRRFIDFMKSKVNELP